MAKKTSRNTEILKDTKNTTSPKIYSLLVELVNDNREDLAEEVLKIDYLLTYTINCVKSRDFREAQTTINMVKERIEKLNDNNVNTEYLQYLYDGTNNRVQSKK